MANFYLKNYGYFNKSEWEILKSLKNKKEKTFTELVEETGFSKPVISKATDNLIKENLIRKHSSKKDQRIRLYKMTKKGRKKYNKTRKKVIKNLKEVKKEVEKDIQET